MTWRSAGRLGLGLAMFFQGCAGLIQDKEGVTGPAEISRGEGSFQVRRGRPGIVIGAPHGTSDKGTDIIARDLAGLTGFSLVVATGFSHLGSDGRRLNVNRPTESVPGTPARLEGESEDARRVYEAYRRHVASLTQVSKVFARCDTSNNKAKNTAQTNSTLADFKRQMNDACKK